MVGRSSFEAARPSSLLWVGDQPERARKLVMFVRVSHQRDHVSPSVACRLSRPEISFLLSFLSSFPRFRLLDSVYLDPWPGRFAFSSSPLLSLSPHTACLTARFPSSRRRL